MSLDSHHGITQIVLKSPSKVILVNEP